MAARLIGAMVVAMSSATFAADASIADVAWLTGCWELSDGRRTVEEVWLAPGGGTMVNVGRTVAGERTVDYELVVIRVQDGRLVYEAHPAGQPTATFVAVQSTATRVVFENPAHDYPQQVGYERVSPDELTAWIDGTQNGQARKVLFPYRRVGCPGSR